MRLAGAVARKYTGHRTDAALMRYLYAPEQEAEEFAAGTGWTPARLDEVKGEV